MRVQAMATGRVVEAGAHHYREDKSPPLSRLLGVEPSREAFPRMHRRRKFRKDLPLPKQQARTHARQDACAGSITVYCSAVVRIDM